jgi:hypothetical protein
VLGDLLEVLSAVAAVAAVWVIGGISWALLVAAGALFYFAQQHADTPLRRKKG